MQFKKISKVVILSLVFMYGVGRSENITEAATYKTQSVQVDSEKALISSSYDSSTILDTSYAKKLKRGCVVVNAKVVCDETYRSKYKKDWASRSKKTVVKATNILYDKFNIYYNVKKGVSWSSGSSKNPDVLLDKLPAKFNVNKDKNTDVVIGFTRKRTGDTIGIGYIGAPYALVCSTVYKTDIQTAQHETGHNYKLVHCGDKNCTMYKYSYQRNIDKLCNTHQKKWKANRKLY